MKNILYLSALILIIIGCKKSITATTKTAIPSTLYTANYKVYDSSFVYWSYNPNPVYHDTTYTIHYPFNAIIALQIDTVNRFILYGNDTFTYLKNEGYNLPAAFGFDDNNIIVTADSVSLSHERYILENVRESFIVSGYRVQ